MISLSPMQRLKKDLKQFEAGLIDETGKVRLEALPIVENGKVKLENLPTTMIQNTWEVATKTALTTLTGADRNDIAYVADEDSNYRLKSDNPGNLADWVHTPFIVQNGTPPVGYSYTRTPGAKLPGDTLQDFTGADITGNYAPADLTACHHPGTVWKLAIRPGDFLRQIGGNGGASVGDTQADQMQSHKIVFSNGSYTLGLSVNSDNIPGSIGGNVNAITKQFFPINSTTQSFSENGYGTPRTGNETRPVNTAGEYWIRVA